MERIYRESNAFDFMAGAKIESHKDAAFIFRQLQNNSCEHAFCCLVKDKQPTIIYLSFGDFYTTMINHSAISDAVYKMQPEALYLVHNHPSGQLFCSKRDREELSKLKKKFGDLVKEGIIINLTSGKYCVFNDTDVLQEEFIEPKITNCIKLFTFDKQVFDKDFNPETDYIVRSSMDVAKFISSHKLGERNKTGVLVVGRNGSLKANIFTQYTQLKQGDIVNVSKSIVQYINTFAGTSAMIYSTSQIKDTIVRQIAKKVEVLSSNQYSVLDIISNLRGVQHKSASNDGILLDPKVKKYRRFL
ncbi:MAG: JAB domain-containing protein [Bacilli bacterium]